MSMNKFFYGFAATAFVALAAVSCCVSADGNVGKRAAALDDTAWNSSKWISVVDAPVMTDTVEDGSRAADGANWFLVTVRNGRKVSSAKWMTTALGVYDIYVNGRLVGDEILKPGFTHCEKTKISFTYDVTDAISKRAGDENVFSAQVTPGWWADKISTPGGHAGMVGLKCAFRSVLELTYADGSKELIGTDTDRWLAGIAGPVRHSAIFDGEEYDARVNQGYETPELLSAPEENTEFCGEIVPSDGAEIYFRDDIALLPVQAYIWEGVENGREGEYGRVKVKKEFAPGEPLTVKPGETLVVDFGQNCAGVPSFVFRAAEGTRMTCLPGELLNDGNGSEERGMDGPEGSVHRRNLRIPDEGMRLEYTFAAQKGNVSFRPRHTFFGYRLVSVTSTDELVIEDIKSVPVTSISAEMESGTLTTGNELVNKLISNTVWGQRSNYLSVPTDCPQRNERLGWMADTQVFAETGTFFANTSRFFHKWMRDVRDSQNPIGAYPGVAPFAQYGANEGDMMRLGWADAGIIVPWTVWKQFDDASIVDECWASMERYMSLVNGSKYDHNVLKELNSNYQWADWLSYEPLESCSGSAFDGDNGPRREAVEYWNYLSASYWAIDAAMMRDMARATGRDAVKYEKMANEAVEYLRKRFLTEDGRFKTKILNTMQTPALFALRNSLVEGKAKENMISGLRANFAAHGSCLQTGFLGTSILMSTLTENGMADIAYELLFQRKNPSWIYSIDNGATTIWERWNSYTLEEGLASSGMNSFNHYAYGAVCEWIWETAAGIAADVDKPGFRHIIMKPVPDRRLGFLDAEYRSAAGIVRSSWKYEGDKWIWNVTIPEGASASITLPGETESAEYAAGTYTFEK